MSFPIYIFLNDDSPHEISAENRLETPYKELNLNHVCDSDSQIRLQNNNHAANSQVILNTRK